MNGIVYKKNTGEILRCLYMTEAMMSLQAGVEESTMIVDADVSDSVHYVNNDEVVLRPAQETAIDKPSMLADGVDSIKITNSPAGTFHAMRIIPEGEYALLTIYAPANTITGSIEGSDTFSTTIPGDYKITIEAFPYLDFEATIEAV